MDVQSSVPYPWKEEYGELFFNLPEKKINLKGKEWFSLLQGKNIIISDTALELLLDPVLNPTELFLGKDISSKLLACHILDLFSLEEIKKMVPVDGVGKPWKTNISFNLFIRRSIKDSEGDNMSFFISVKEKTISLKAIINNDNSLQNLKSKTVFVF